MRTKKLKREVMSIRPAGATRPIVPAPKAKPKLPAVSETPAEPTMAERIAARLPTDSLAALDLALKTGRYLVMVVRLDSKTNTLEMHRHVRDIPAVDFPTIVTLLKNNLEQAQTNNGGQAAN